MLHAIAHSDLPLRDKLGLLPVVSESDFEHLHSKIGLSKLFLKAGIKTPPFRIAANREESREAAEELGYPVLLKVDASGGGCGIHECRGDEDFRLIPDVVWKRPVLLQKKLNGAVLDLSALFLRTELIHFSYSTMDKVVSNRFGPSSLRTYRPLCRVERLVFDEPRALGKALGADGFCNICCIDADDGSGRWFVEADMRPNVLVDTPHYLGEELAVRIAGAFRKGEKLQIPHEALSELLPDRQIPHFLRLSPLELLLNRYNVWRYVPTEDLRILLRVLFRRMRKYRARHFLRDTLNYRSRQSPTTSF